MRAGSIALLLSLLTLAPPRAAGQGVPPGFAVEHMATLEYPTTIAFIGDDDLLALEKNSGRVRRVRFTESGTVIQTVLQISVNNMGERGLLGIALAPGFPSPSYVYLYYSESACINSNGHRISQYHWTGNALQFPLLVDRMPCGAAFNHSGGVLAFGPDGALYAAIGDMFYNNVAQNVNNGQFTESGVVLRMNAIGGGLFDNPFATVPGWEKVWGYGVRNCFGMTFDPLSGYLWFSENGPQNYDEINLAVPGFNSGWKPIMGPDALDPNGVGDLVNVPGSTYIDPRFSWNDTIAPTALCFLHSPRWDPLLRDDLLVGDFFGRVSRFQLNDRRDNFVLTGSLSDGVADTFDEGQALVWADRFGTISDMKLGPDGYLYVVVHDESGAIYRVRPVHPMGDLDLDGDLDAADRTLFIELLISPPKGHGGVPGPGGDGVGGGGGGAALPQADFTGDGVVDAGDIPGFVESLYVPQ